MLKGLIKEIKWDSWCKCISPTRDTLIPTYLHPLVMQYNIINNNQDKNGTEWNVVLYGRVH